MAWGARNVISTQGFSMHPHRGFDILTYILDGSDGFRHRDSLGGEKTYRGSSAQWMRTGAGAMHEEFWETHAARVRVSRGDGVTSERAQV